jgi:hypothetical protein
MPSKRTIMGIILATALICAAHKAMSESRRSCGELGAQLRANVAILLEIAEQRLPDLAKLLETLGQTEARLQDADRCRPQFREVEIKALARRENSEAMSRPSPPELMRRLNRTHKGPPTPDAPAFNTPEYFAAVRGLVNDLKSATGGSRVNAEAIRRAAESFHRTAR